MRAGRRTKRCLGWTLALLLTVSSGSAAADTTTNQLTPTAPFSSSAPATATTPTNTSTGPGGGATAPGRQLPFTGDDLWPEAIAAAGLLVAGGLLRRRPAASPSRR